MPLPKLPKGALEALNHSLMTPATGEAVSPLSALLATRLSAQLEALQQGPLSGLQGVNLPAAYAGDQRSLRAAQRRLSEEEQGIASPSRRKFIKQAAAGAARSALPDSLATGMTTALEEAVKSGVVKDLTSKPVNSILDMTRSIMAKSLDLAGEGEDLLTDQAWQVLSETFGDKAVHGTKAVGRQLRQLLGSEHGDLKHLTDAQIYNLVQEAENIVQSVMHVEDMVGNGFYGKYMFRELPGFGYGEEGAKQFRRLPQFEKWITRNYLTPSRATRSLGLTSDDLRGLNQEAVQSYFGEEDINFEDAMREAYDSAVYHAIENVHGDESLPPWFDSWDQLGLSE